MNSAYKPERKVTAAVAIGTPAGVIVAWAVGLTGVEVPPTVAAAMGSLISGVIAYFTPNK